MTPSVSIRSWPCSDLFVLSKGKRFGFELKYSDAPSLARSMHIALADLQLDKLWIVYPGSQPYDLHDKVSVTPLAAVASAFQAS